MADSHVLPDMEGGVQICPGSREGRRKKSDMIDVDMRFLYSCNELRRNFYLDSILLDKRLE